MIRASRGINNKNPWQPLFTATRVRHSTNFSICNAFVLIRGIRGTCLRDRGRQVRGNQKNRGKPKKKAQSKLSFDVGRKY